MVISRILPSPYIETKQIWIEEFRFGSVLMEQHLQFSSWFIIIIVKCHYK